MRGGGGASLAKVNGLKAVLLALHVLRSLSPGVQALWNRSVLLGLHVAKGFVVTQAALEGGLGGDESLGGCFGANNESRDHEICTLFELFERRFTLVERRLHGEKLEARRSKALGV